MAACNRGALRGAVILAGLAIIGCSTAPTVPMQPQPELAQLAEPYAGQLRAARIMRIEAGGGAMVRSSTETGTVYTRYPQDMAMLRWVLYIDTAGVHADAPNFDASGRAQYAQALQAILPEAIRAAERNNVLVFERSNPDH